MSHTVISYNSKAKLKSPQEFPTEKEFINYLLNRSRSFSDAPARLQPHLEKLQKSIEKVDEFEQPAAYWSGLWDKPHDKHTVARVIVERQGLAIRVKYKKEQGSKERVFEKDWNEEPNMWGDDFLMDGYDRFNSADREVFGQKRPKGNKRPIHEFSANSRRNLLDKLMSIDPEAWKTAKFATFTYHEKWPDPKAAKNQLRALFKKIVRHCEKKNAKKHEGDKLYAPAFFWRLEPKVRLSGEHEGQLAPHFHCFFFGCPYIPRELLLKWWRQIVGDKTITQLDIRKLNTFRKAMNYVAKYVAKPTDQDKFVSYLGRDSAAGAYEDWGRGVLQRIKEAQKNESQVSSTINSSSTVATESAAPAAYLELALYLAGMGRFWGFEGGKNLPFAALDTAVVAPLAVSVLTFISVCEQQYPFLGSRWSYGFRLFVMDNAYDWADLFNTLFRPDWMT